MKRLLAEYNRKRGDIKKRLKDFGDSLSKKDEDIFAELCYCLFTPQSKAVNCDKAVQELKRTGLLMKGDKRSIASKLRHLVRFHNNKASYVVEARKFFTKDGSLDMKGWLAGGDAFEKREGLVKHIKGLGYKEASHFLRNIGLAKEMAILDVHIMRNLKKQSVIEDVPKSLTTKRYLDIEDRMRGFSRKACIPVDELDLLFWSRQTGFIFK